MRFTLSEKKLRNRIVEEISALRYPPEDAHHLVDEVVKDFRYSLQDKEDAILQELLATKKIGLGLGWGPGGGPYSYIFLDQITPQFVHDIISQSEGRTFYDLEPRGCELEAAGLFMQAWEKAIKEGLKQRLFFRYRGRYYTDEAMCLQAKADFQARHTRPAA